jgi:hypothetical protein
MAREKYPSPNNRAPLSPLSPRLNWARTRPLVRRPAVCRPTRCLNRPTAMLSQTRHLLQTSQGRYATDAELAFFESYAQSYRLRLQTYRKLQSLEREIIVQVFRRLKANNPQVFQRGSQDFTQKWQRDTIWVLRFSALAMLFDDTDALRDRLLLWFQTVMRAFGSLQVTRMTYESMQVVVRQLFDPQEAELLCHVLEVNRETFDLPDP